ncbi:LOW QUALITY PROTEIN: uncharacterized protein AAEQ78_026265 [Lycaon pictus]
MAAVRVSCRDGISGGGQRCSLADAGGVGELGEVGPLVQFEGAQAVIAVRGRDCDGLGSELVVKVPGVNLRGDLRLEGWQKLLLYHVLPADAEEEPVLHDLPGVAGPPAEPLLGVLLKQPSKQGLGLGAECAREMDLLYEDEHEEALVVLVVEGQAAAHHLVHDHAQPPPVHRAALVLSSSTSGARYSGIPQKVFMVAPSLMPSLHRPKSVCMECQGHGERISPKDRCKSCNGRKIVQEKKILEVHIDKGMKDGQKITFHSEGDQEPGLEPGDIVIVLDQKDHAVFTGGGEDLFMCMDIQLVEALCGFQKPISTLDNRTIVITSHPGQIVKHGDIKCVLNEGMPIYRRPYEKGHLIIEFKVNFPENGFLSPDKLSLLEKLLPKEVEETDEMDQVELVDFDPNQERWRHYNGEAYEDDEHHPRGGVQCQTS